VPFLYLLWKQIHWNLNGIKPKSICTNYTPVPDPQGKNSIAKMLSMHDLKPIAFMGLQSLISSHSVDSGAGSLLWSEHYCVGIETEMSTSSQRHDAHWTLQSASILWIGSDRQRPLAISLALARLCRRHEVGSTNEENLFQVCIWPRPMQRTDRRSIVPS